MVGKNKVLHSIHHLLTGTALTLKGADKISHHAVLGGIILLFGILILTFFIYTLIKKLHSDRFELMVRGFEAIASLFIAYIFFTEGKELIQYVFLIAAVGFITSIFLYKKKAH
jgi:TRAP-type uncharacterized transport system fused permease subunit